jgi:hypothetical protein
MLKIEIHWSGLKQFSHHFSIVRIDSVKNDHPSNPAKLVGLLNALPRSRWKISPKISIVQQLTFYSPNISLLFSNLSAIQTF